MNILLVFTNHTLGYIVIPYLTLRTSKKKLQTNPAGWRLGALRKLHHSAVLAIGAGEWYLTVSITCGFFGPIHTKKECTEKMRFG